MSNYHAIVYAIPETCPSCYEGRIINGTICDNCDLQFEVGTPTHVENDIFIIIEYGLNYYLAVKDWTKFQPGSLEASIKKWELLVEAEKEFPSHMLYEGGRFTCSLCHKFYNQCCEGCIVKNHTGKCCCMNTPYTDDDAEGELEFLVKLREKHANTN